MCENQGLTFLGLILLPGAFGGLVRWVLRRDKGTASPLMYKLGQAGKLTLAGASGALALMLALTIAATAVPNPTENPCKEWQLLVALFFVAGFIGHRMLPAVAVGLERRVAGLVAVKGKARPPGGAIRSWKHRRSIVLFGPGLVAAILVAWLGNGEGWGHALIAFVGAFMGSGGVMLYEVWKNRQPPT